MSQAHKNALHDYLKAGSNLHHQAGSRPPANPMKVIAASCKDELLEPVRAADAKPDMSALTNALTAGRLTPADAQKVVTHLSLGLPMPDDLSRRVAAVLSGKQKP